MLLVTPNFTEHGKAFAETNKAADHQVSNPAKPISRRRCSNNVQKFSRNDLCLLAHVDERYELGCLSRKVYPTRTLIRSPKSTRPLVCKLQGFGRLQTISRRTAHNTSWQTNGRMSETRRY